MKTQLLYFLNRLIGRGDKFLLETMICYESDIFFRHELDRNMFWDINFPYQYVNQLKEKALTQIIDETNGEIARIKKLLAESA